MERLDCTHQQDQGRMISDGDESACLIPASKEIKCKRKGFQLEIQVISPKET